jgi:crotonobetainyl-CoA:carnitine CoA-transferase CaiB-like acyl-CoA transferase
MDELWEDEHIAANGYLEHYEHPLLGTLGGPAPIVRMSGTPTRIQRASPVLGEHTDEVMREVGLSGEEVERLRGLGVVG